MGRRRLSAPEGQSNTHTFAHFRRSRISDAREHGSAAGEHHEFNMVKGSCINQL